eukprot:TRINITY_DN8120_c0_g1_i1.p1 TRINITY_DN8120_c0_g1~~TRINITY_DN8120_c0_g1_i1.p1  ORF type:complete len:1189 (-),score=396.77 TRINITY_DN8120_c0_g1_i1:579-4019(-)
MSTNFVKPESALKRAEELIAVGKNFDALDTLHAAVLHRRFKNQWTTVLESIVERHLGLCVELKKIRIAREALHQYRSTCQAANITSLEKVCRGFCTSAEEKVNAAKKEQDIKMATLGDLDEMESPESILLQAIQAGDTRQQSQDKDIHTQFRFLWDAYKVTLDVLKSNNRLEEVYHDMSRHAFEFCKANSRPQEFKRLCDILRKNYQDLFKRTGSGPSSLVQPNASDTVTKTLETRCNQMQVATELDLWREAYYIATEICELMAKTRPKPHLRSMYYNCLGEIFWKSENYLFHAFATLKNTLFVKAAKQTAAKDELESLASKAVLATLCVPFATKADLAASLEMSSDSASHAHEKAKKYAALFSAQSVPTRESISSQIVEKNLLSLASEPCQKLFALIESDFTPLSLCQDAKPYLDKIASEEVCGGKLVNYATPLKQIIFFRLMKQLSEVYLSMKIEDFEKAASIVTFDIAEKWMANASRQHGINIQINYMQKAIVFGGARGKVDMKAMRQPLMQIGNTLQLAMRRVAQEELVKKDKAERAVLLTDMRERMEQETQQIRRRKDEIERRKEESEKRKAVLEREAMKKQREQDEADAAAERARQEVERARREAERKEKKQKEAELAKNKEMLEQMKKQADRKADNLKVGGKKITEIEAEDLETISVEQIEKAREAQNQRERQEKIRNRKLECKRIDHLARALREEQADCLEEWAYEVEEEDAKLLEEAEIRNAGEQQKKHEEGLVEKEKLLPFRRVKDDWAKDKLVDREADYEEALAAQVRRLQGKVVQNKIARAKERLKQYETKEAHSRAEAQRQREREEEERKRAEQQRLEEERRREEEEREAERRAELEAKRAAAAERRKEEDEMRARMDAKRREKERELEEREQQEKLRREQERDSARRPAPAAESGGGSWRNRDAPARDAPARGAPARDAPARDAPARGNDDAGGWRSRPAKESEPASDRRAPGGDRPSWRDRKEETPAEDAGGWRRNAPADRTPGGGRSEKSDDGPGAWRRPGGGRSGEEQRPAPSNSRGESDAGAWRRPAAASTPKANDDGPGAWRRGPPKDRDEDGPRRVAPSSATPAARAAEPPAKAAAAEEDEGWGTVTKKTRATKPKEPEVERKAAPRSGDAGDRRPTPPWKRNAKK